MDYGNQEIVFQSLGNFDKAQEYHEKALAIRMKIGDKGGEAADYGCLGSVFQSLGSNGLRKLRETVCNAR